MLAQKYTTLSYSHPIVLRRLAKILNTHHSIDGFYINLHGLQFGTRCNRAKTKENRLFVHSLAGKWVDVTDNWQALDLRDTNGRSIEPSRLDKP